MCKKRSEVERLGHGGVYRWQGRRHVGEGKGYVAGVEACMENTGRGGLTRHESLAVRLSCVRASARGVHVCRCAWTASGSKTVIKSASVAGVAKDWRFCI